MRKEFFDASSARFIRSTFRSKPNVLVLSHETDPRKRQIAIRLAGERLSDQDIVALKGKLADFGLKETELTVIQSGQVMPDMNAVKKDLINEFMQIKYPGIEERDARILALQTELADLRKSADWQLRLRAIQREIQAQFPDALEINVTTGLGATAEQARTILLVQIKLKTGISTAEKERLRMGLRERAGMADLEDVRLDILSASSPRSKQKAPR